MADAVLFIGWGAVVPGREHQALAVFSEGVAYWQHLQQQGAIDSFETVGLEPHGGELRGFVLVRGERQTLERLRYSEECLRLNARAAFVIQSYGVVAGFGGEALNRQFASVEEHTADLR